MSMSTRLLAASLIIPPLILLQQAFRLRAAYPVRHISPAFEISLRTDSPAVGMKSSTSWLRPDAGEEFTADVPAHLLQGDAPAEVIFARAFWGSWPLALESRLVRFLARNNIGSFGLRSGGLEGEKVAEAERVFAPKAKVIGGLVSVLVPRLHYF